MENSKIGWTHHTQNSWEGCAHKIDVDPETGKGEEDPACQGCYAEVQRDHRWGTVKWGPGQPRRLTSETNRNKPRIWNRKAGEAGVRERVFALSLGDWLDPEVPIAWLAELISLIDETPNLDWLLLTKRIELWESRMHQVVQATHDGADTIASHWLDGDFPQNVWLGATAGTQKTFDRRAPILASLPARYKFLSMEPLLEDIDLRYWAANGDSTPESFGIDWIIVGGESGADSRPFHLEHAESIVRQARLSGVKIYVKQMGDLPVMSLARWEANPQIELDLNKRDKAPEGTVPLRFAGKGEDISAYPESLRIREFPDAP